MTTFTKPVLRELREQLQTLLDNIKYVGTAQGLDNYTFEIGNCTYEGGEATFKLNVLIKGAETVEQKLLRDMAALNDLDTDKSASLQGMTVYLVGYKAKARKRPWVVATSPNSQRYVIDNATAKRLFGKLAEVS